MRILIHLLIWPALFAVAASSSRGESAEEKGLAIARESKERDTGYGDFVSDVRMILRNQHGQESSRSLTISTLESPPEGEKALVVFEEPRDVQGTALLSFSYKEGDDDQWLYLPAVRRVRRIAAATRTGSFVGSEFSYEDISPQQVERYTYEYLRDETYEGMDCYVVERRPVDKRSGYSRQVVWVDKEEYRPMKFEMYDRRDAHLKTLKLSGYEQYLDEFWRPGKSEMINHRSGKSTVLEFTNYRFGTGLKESDFNANALQRLQ